MPVAREGACLAAGQVDLRAVAVILDFVGPAVAFWPLVDQRRNAWRDERGPALVLHRSAAVKAARLVFAKSGRLHCVVSLGVAADAILNSRT